MSEKACPFCGKSDKLSIYMPQPHLKFVDCKRCEAGKVYADEWNTRPIEDKMQVERAEARTWAVKFWKVARRRFVEIQRLKAERRWIPVEEKLPEVDKEVLVLFNGETPFQCTGYGFFSDWFYTMPHGAEEPARMIYVTHWQYPPPLLETN